DRGDEDAKGERDNEYQRCHWITSSAWKRMDGGIARPSAFAVLRLMISSNFMGRSTGNSAGLVPCRILSTYEATPRYWYAMSYAYDRSPPAATASRPSCTEGNPLWTAKSM